MRLQTPRLRLVPFSPGHLDALHAHWTVPAVRKFLWDDEVISFEQVESSIDFSRRSFADYGFGFWALFPRDASELVGFAGLRHFGDDDEIELLYSLDPTAWGRGLATEASEAVLRHAFETLGLDTIFAGADPPNTASFGVMDRLGFGDEHRREVEGLEGLEAIYRSLDRDAFLARLDTTT